MTKQQYIRIALFIFLVLVSVSVSYEFYSLLKERNQLKANIADLSNKIDFLNKDNSNLRSEIDYYSHPENLKKELLSKFNYKKPGEKMIIVVP